MEELSISFTTEYKNGELAHFPKISGIYPRIECSCRRIDNNSLDFDFFMDKAKNGISIPDWMIEFYFYTNVSDIKFRVGETALCTDEDNLVKACRSMLKNPENLLSGFSDLKILYKNVLCSVAQNDCKGNCESCIYGGNNWAE